jgi:hypothetical protein
MSVLEWWTIATVPVSCERGLASRILALIRRRSAPCARRRIGSWLHRDRRRRSHPSHLRGAVRSRLHDHRADHLPTARLVARAIQELQRLASTVVILEPYIAGVTGNVSGKRRQQVKPGLPRGHKVFAPHSCLWDYPRWFGPGQPMPLHPASLGPFYHRFVWIRT